MNTNERIIARLTAMGCDVPGALPRFGGNRDFYCRLLAMAAEDENFEKLRAAIAADDALTAFDAAHALKGVLGNMGLTPMYEETCAIVEPLRAGRLDGTAERCRTLLEQREKLAQLLKEGGGADG